MLTLNNAVTQNSFNLDHLPLNQLVQWISKVKWLEEKALNLVELLVVFKEEVVSKEVAVEDSVIEVVSAAAEVLQEVVSVVEANEKAQLINTKHLFIF